MKAFTKILVHIQVWSRQISHHVAPSSPWNIICFGQILFPLEQGISIAVVLLLWTQIPFAVGLSCIVRYFSESLASSHEVASSMSSPPRLGQLKMAPDIGGQRLHDSEPYAYPHQWPRKCFISVFWHLWPLFLGPILEVVSFLHVKSVEWFMISRVCLIDWCRGVHIAYVLWTLTEINLIFLISFWELLPREVWDICIQGPASHEVGAWLGRGARHGSLRTSLLSLDHPAFPWYLSATWTQAELLNFCLFMEHRSDVSALVCNQFEMKACWPVSWHYSPRGWRIYFFHVNSWAMWLLQFEKPSLVPQTKWETSCSWDGFRASSAFCGCNRKNCEVRQSHRHIGSRFILWACVDYRPRWKQSELPMAFDAHIGLVFARSKRYAKY